MSSMSYSYLPVLEAEAIDSHEHEYPPIKLFGNLHSRRSISEFHISFLRPPYDVGYPHLVHFGLVFSLVVGGAFIFLGALIFVISPSSTIPSNLLIYVPTWSPEEERNITFPLHYYLNVALGLALSFLVTVCTEATGYVHGTTLKWGLAEENHLGFNANLRLFSATTGVFSVNGPVVNMLFLISIVLSYAASASVLFRFNIYADGSDTLENQPSLWNRKKTVQSYSTVSFLPLLILGASLVLQAVLGLIAFHKRKVPTWSSSPLDVISALVHHGSIKHRPGRCMRSAAKIDNATAPIKPSLRQPKPWACHRFVAWVVYLVWTVAVIFLALPWIYTFVPGISGYISWAGPAWNGLAPPVAVLEGSMIVGAVQALITVSLHCSELVTTLARDEEAWKAAATPEGAQPSGNPLKALLGSWQTCGLVLWKPVLHWLYGLSLSLELASGLTLSKVSLALGPGMIVVAVFVTVIANLRPSGPQPAAYGNVQVLADLVDEWSMSMYWGHKGARRRGMSLRRVCHAGTTSEGSLPTVEMDSDYA